MGLLEYILIAVMIVQWLFTLLVIGNYRYAIKYLTRKLEYQPRCVLIVPCKGLDQTFDENIESFFQQDYQGYHIYFVVADRDDPAYERLLILKARHIRNSKAESVKILVAGESTTCSQKLHNLIYAYQQIPADTDALVFADSDACAGGRWLLNIVFPLRKDKTGAASGYRCFIPRQNNVATLTLAGINAVICEFLGNTRFNLAWGGSMAILVDRFRELGLDKTWTQVLSDDLSLSTAVRRKGLKMAFVPTCMIASYETTTWGGLFEFARRQFVITRVYTPGMWLFGACSVLYAVLGLWGGIALAIWATVSGYEYARLCWLVPAVVYICQLFRAVLRQRLIGTLLPQDKERLKIARWADILFFWFFGWILLGVIALSAFGRTITWRHIKYKLVSPTDIRIIDN